MSPDNSGVKAEFDRAAKTYDSLRRLMIPCFDDFYGTAVRMLPFDASDPFDVLDLGAGTGLLSAFVRERFPLARLTLIDISDEMLIRARERFAGAENVQIAVSDYSVEALPGRFDAIVSALSIHHLDDPGKAASFRRVHAALNPGGIFVNAEEVLAPTTVLDALYWDKWERLARAAGAPDEEFANVEERAKYDKPARLQDQLDWLREAGFDDVDCYYKYLMFVVYGGRKPA
ncbi:MAG: methyltransferase domain-containing protein [Dehalococcoidia bacterium]